jgi:uncharacterized membrane protein required for colicin V production
VVLDIILLFPLIGFAVLGFRDGSARKLVAIAVIILGMFLGQQFMHDLGKFLVDKFNFQPATAPITAFLMIFLILFMLQLVLYRILTGNYKFAVEGAGAMVDRIIAVPLGLAEGVIFLSVIIFLMVMQDGPPRSQTTRESRLYTPVATVAPQIMDLFSTALPAAKEALDNVAAPDAAPADSVTPESVEKLTSPGQGAVDSTLQNARR